jgi:microsomal dipeptidase-like Zn-dependent dipeptidase
MADATAPRIDALQYCNWSEAVFRQMRAGKVDAVHATVAYHGGFREAAIALADWNRRFRRHGDLIRLALSAADIRAALAEGRTAILLGFQNPSPIEDDLGLLELWHRMGIRAMQLTYNNQSLLGTGCAEDEDTGLTRMGREAVAEMNRLGMAIDMSHAAPRTTLEAIEASAAPVAVTHANPRAWLDVARNVPDRVIDALAGSGGMLGFSLYPHHLAGGSHCTLEAFCAMVARTAERVGTGCLGIGSDLCQDQPDEVVAWMREGRWSRRGWQESDAAFPPQTAWFRDNRDLARVAEGLAAAGFDAGEVGAIMGGNWLRHFARVLDGAG